MRNRPRGPGSTSRWVAATALALVLLPSCFTMQHTFGTGPTKGTTREVQQWYGLFGLVAIGGEPDSAELLDKGSSGARVTTRFTPMDVFLSAFTSFLSFYRQTITVEQ
jgi:hypothetical protein